MKQLAQKIKKLFTQFLGIFPTSLPQGVSEFEAWAKSIEDTYQLPTLDSDSIKFALSTMIMHLGPTVDRKPKYYFVLAIRAGAAKQVAGAVFQQIKQKQAEATALAQAAASNGLSK